MDGRGVQTVNLWTVGCFLTQEYGEKVKFRTTDSVQTDYCQMQYVGDNQTCSRTTFGPLC